MLALVLGKVARDISSSSRLTALLLNDLISFNPFVVGDRTVLLCRNQPDQPLQNGPGRAGSSQDKTTDPGLAADARDVIGRYRQMS